MHRHRWPREVARAWRLSVLRKRTTSRPCAAGVQSALLVALLGVVVATTACGTDPPAKEDGPRGQASRVVESTVWTRATVNEARDSIVLEYGIGLCSELLKVDKQLAEGELTLTVLVSTSTEPCLLPERSATTTVGLSDERFDRVTDGACQTDLGSHPPFCDRSEAKAEPCVVWTPGTDCMPTTRPAD